MKKIKLCMWIIFLSNVLIVDAMLTRSTQAARAAQRTRTRVTQPTFYQRFKSWWAGSKNGEPGSTSVVSPAALAPSAQKASNVSLIVKDETKEQSPTFGWGSFIPGGAEYKAKQVVNSIDQLIKDMEQKGVEWNDLSRYKELRAQYTQLMPGQDYNPIKENSSLLVKEAKEYLQGIESQNGFFSESVILKQLYNEGIRLSQAEIEDVMKSTGWDAFAKRLADRMDVIHDTDKLTIQAVGIEASLIVSSYRLFQSFGIDITHYFGRSFNMEAMAWLSSEWLSIKRETDQEVFTGGSVNGKPVYANVRLDNVPMGYLKSEITQGVHASRMQKAERDPFRDYPTGYGQRSTETNPAAPILKAMRKDNYKYLDIFIANAKSAGFFRSVPIESVYLPSNFRDEKYMTLYNTLMQNKSYTGNEQAYRAFMKEYGLDTLKHKLDSGEMSQEEYNSRQSDIAALNDARRTYFAVRRTHTAKE